LILFQYTPVTTGNHEAVVVLRGRGGIVLKTAIKGSTMKTGSKWPGLNFTEVELSFCLSFELWKYLSCESCK